MNFQKLPNIWLSFVLVVFVVGVIVVFLAASDNFTLGFVAGGALGVINTFISARNVKRADFSMKGPTMAALVGGFYGRLLVLAVCLYALIGVWKVHPLGLVTGLSVAPAGLFLMLALIHIANRRPKEV